MKTSSITNLQSSSSEMASVAISVIEKLSDSLSDISTISSTMRSSVNDVCNILENDVFIIDEEKEVLNCFAKKIEGLLLEINDTKGKIESARSSMVGVKSELILASESIDKIED